MWHNNIADSKHVKRANPLSQKLVTGFKKGIFLNSNFEVLCFYLLVFELLGCALVIFFTSIKG